MRVFDAEAHNVIANHPLVFEHLGCTREDFPETKGFVLFDAEAAETDRYWFLCNAERDAGMIFEWTAPDCFEMHTMMLPSCRGRRALTEGKALIREMFSEHNAQMIWGRTPVGNKAARWFNRQCGGKHHSFGRHWKLGEVELFRNFRGPWLAEFGEARAPTA